MLKKRSIIVIFIAFGSILFAQITPLRIAVSSSSPNYENWILRADSTVILLDMKKLNVDSALKVIETCNGLLLTGGEDVVPAYYGKAADSLRCVSNPHRDSLEIAIIRKAMEIKLPILGICRGQQLLNVIMRGTLFIDLPTDKPSEITHRCADYLQCFHKVRIKKTSNLKQICHSDSGIVTSNHHQAVEKLAACFRAVAWSDDGIIEAIEYKYPRRKPFLQAVQWHPERMQKEDNLSKPLVEAFLKSTRKK